MPRDAALIRIAVAALVASALFASGAYLAAPTSQLAQSALPTQSPPRAPQATGVGAGACSVSGDTVGDANPASVYATACSRP